MRLNRDSGFGAKFIGIDGGGSKTGCVLGDAGGRILGYGAGGSSNMKSKPWDAVKEVLIGLIDQVLKQGATDAQELDTIVLGLAGDDRAEDRERVVSSLAASFHRMCD